MLLIFFAVTAMADQKLTKGMLEETQHSKMSSFSPILST